MFVRKSTRKYNGKVFTNYLLVESVRTPKGPRQKTICSLGDLSPRPRAQWLKLAHKVEIALVGQEDWIQGQDPEVDQIVRKIKSRQAAFRPADRDTVTHHEDDLVAVRTAQVCTEQHREAGPVHVGLNFWKRLDLDTILQQAGLTKRTRTLSCAMTLARLIHPCSEHAMPDWIRTTALSDLLGTDFGDLAHHALYRNMDRLHPKRAMIESKLADKERSLFNLDQTILFYDLTSTYFEGLAEKNPKAKRGYSRDRRPDCKQVVVGLVINRDGFPVGHEIFEGNTQDKNSLGQMLDLLDQRVGLKPGQTVVVDRGMSFDDNLDEIRARDLHYIVASRQKERDQWLGDFEDAVGFEEIIRQPSPLNPFQNKSKVQVKMKRHNDETHVLCLSEGRTLKDRAIREKHEKRLFADLAKLEKRITNGRIVKLDKIGEAIGRLKERYPRVARYYHIAFDAKTKQLIYTENEDKRSKAEQLDGSYLLKTDRDDLTAEEAWRIYILLTRAENAFRSMKSPLAERPIFHHLEHRVDTHIFLCVLAYHLLVAIEKTLLDKGVHTSWGSVKEQLRTHQISTIVLPTDDGSILRIRRGSTPEPQHQELYDLLEIPSELMEPIRTWTHQHQQNVVTEKKPNPSE